jgi:hypothetical protein
MSNCYYSTQGVFTCQKEPYHVDTTGAFRGVPYKNISWSTAPQKDLNPICYGDRLCCNQNDGIGINCKPSYCCQKK